MRRMPPSKVHGADVAPRGPGRAAVGQSDQQRSRGVNAASGDQLPAGVSTRADGEAGRDPGHHPAVQVAGLGDGRELDAAVAARAHLPPRRRTRVHRSERRSASDPGARRTLAQFGKRLSIERIVPRSGDYPEPDKRIRPHEPLVRFEPPGQSHKSGLYGLRGLPTPMTISAAHTATNATRSGTLVVSPGSRKSGPALCVGKPINVQT